jgi:choline kinase
VALGPDGRILNIGKTLERYDAVDTGIFIATPALLDAIREAVAAGGAGSLSEGVQRLADRGRAHAVPSGGRWWIDVDDEAAHRRAEATLPAMLAPA